MTLVERIKNFGKARGMGLKEIALKSGLSENAIYGWNSHTPNEATLRAVAQTLGVSYEVLIGKKKPDPKGELASQVGALFRSVVDQQDLDEAHTIDLKQEMEDLLKVRAKRLREKQNGKG
ncbi:helix-turn-helix domain-containing protein [Lacticaseibacillus paracasei]|uniref:helix-turn-helix domain-containing protein n=1 Tax=Lacticaseibacillus paracasei TaxID=1597 RepID=UPI001C110EFC|nr:helix-turn-helix transcriptional regulator [Lacticaseibacillus paracasei]MBU5324076.1 helix-turn-helix transcriptional regulator [Lacticaseibacillus paracasei]